MITIRKAQERGHANYGWLDTHHTFSFSNYYDPNHTQFRSLRVMNEDRVQPGQGFGAHGHQDMEILTYVLEGALEHKDSMGSGSILRPGEVQYMSAGSGIRHSEYNASTTEPVHFYQIWIVPNQKGLPPQYAQKSFPAADRTGRLQLVASPEPANGALEIRADARLYLANLDLGQSLTHAFEPARHGWLQVLRGAVTVNGHSLQTSDGAQIGAGTHLLIEASEPAEILLFDLA